MSTDRPDVTESAYSLDAGHLQVETDVVRFGTRRFGVNTSQEELALNHANVKLGLTSRLDVQLVVESYTRQTERPTNRAEPSTYRAGFGDLTLRLKRNLWGNDGGRSALAVMPFIKLPTGRSCGNRAWEGGVVVPFALQLPRDWSLGSQLQTTLIRDEDSGYNCVELAPTVTVGHDLYKTLGGFVELAGSWDTREQGRSLTVNGGPIWRVSDNLQLDLGINYPLTADTETTYFLGVSFRR
ncbi:transporter [Hymenobacter oligotrophus]|nr:transporter [Hymenobacter oligotrophus]